MSEPIDAPVIVKQKSSGELWADYKRARDACDRELESTLWREFIRVAEEEQRTKGVIG